MAKASLSPAAWIDAGLDQLTVHGPTALRAEPLARHLKTSKGSFYWHFKDVPAFQDALLDTWKTQALAALSEETGQDGSNTDKLIRFGQNVQKDTPGPALRAWAKAAPGTAAAVAEVDAARLARITALLGEVGVTNPDFARAAYGALIGLKQMDTENGDALVAYAALIDLVLALK